MSDSNDQKITGVAKGGVIAMKLATTALLAPPLLSITLVSGPNSLISNDFNSFAAEKGIATAYTKDMNTDNIRIYGRSNPLVPFHAAGKVMFEYKRQMEQRIAKNGLDVGSGQVLEKAMSIYPASLFSMSELSLKAAFGSGTTAYALSSGQEPAGTCYILPPGDMDAAELISGLTDIDAKYFEKFAQAANISDQEAFTFAFVHETTHCGQGEGHLLDKETGADLGFVRESVAQTGRNDMAKLLLYSRAIGVFSKKGTDIGHATALGIAAFLKNEAQPDPDSVSRDLSDLRQVVDQRVSEAAAGQERFVAVYHVMKDMLKNGEISEGTMKDAAELYVQGVEYLAPESVSQGVPVSMKAPVVPSRVF